MGQHLVFVYGTLKRGYSNNRRLNGSRFIGPAVTKGRFAMWDYGPFPMVAKASHRLQDVHHPVSGEVFLVDDAGLRGCDQLEGHPNFYRRARVRVNIKIGRHRRRRFAWIYLRKMRDGTGYDFKQPDTDGYLRWVPFASVLRTYEEE